MKLAQKRVLRQILSCDSCEQVGRKDWDNNKEVFSSNFLAVPDTTDLVFTAELKQK